MAQGFSANAELLEVLGEVKAKVQDRLGIMDFPLPQFCLIGQQSVGKSRVIECLAGEPFNFSSGTLGSRRPTVLTFVNVPHLTTSKWHVRDLQTKNWAEHSVTDVMRIVGDAHQSLGNTVTGESLYVKVESAGCVDVQIVDLPGFREYADTPEKKQLKDDIENLVRKYMADENNTILCVEPAGDAATYKTLNECINMNIQNRTILIRNKLDKYYTDLDPSCINQWFDGNRSFPADLPKFCFSSPHWSDSAQTPAAKDFKELRDKANQQDIEELSSRELDPSRMPGVGFSAFSSFMEKKTQQLFVQDLPKVIRALKILKDTNESKMKGIDEEDQDTDPAKVEGLTRQCASSFAEALANHMEGQVVDKTGSLTLREELHQFRDYFVAVISGKDPRVMPSLDPRGMPDPDGFCKPSEDLNGLDEYIDYLESKNEGDIGNAMTKHNGGTQYRRLMNEVEVFLRFAELADWTKKTDVIQARGIAMTSLGWRDVVVKLLNHQAHEPLLRKIRYVGERIRWFFVEQKESVLEFMCALNTQGGALGGRFSVNLPKHGQLMKNHTMMKHMIFKAYDDAVYNQMEVFLSTFDDMMTSMFANPWVFLKGATTGRALDAARPVSAQDRIPKEMESRSGVETLVNGWLQDIPTENSEIDKAVDKVIALLLKTYSHIRSQVCDQVEQLAELFFKLPMLRRLNGDFAQLTLSPHQKEQYKIRRTGLTTQKRDCNMMKTEIDECLTKLTGFQQKILRQGR